MVLTVDGPDAEVAPQFPWWLEEAIAADPGQECAPALVGRTTADVVVVGAGYTGLWTALALTQRDPGIHVMLLESDVVGNGPSGRNGGLLHGYWEQLPSLADLFGVGSARALAQAGSCAQRAIIQFCENSADDAWLRNSGMIMAATSPQQEATLDRVLADADRLHCLDQVSPLSSEDVRARCDSPRFRRGVLFHEAGTIQPARLARALRRAAIEAGVTLHENSHVVDIKPGPTSTVMTSLGVVECSDVVLATNSSLATHKMGRRCLVNLSSYVLLTEPIPHLLDEINWVSGEGFRDARMYLHYFRTTHDGRIAFGSGSGPLGHARLSANRLCYDQATVRRMISDFRWLFPNLANVQFTHAWGGPIDMSSDHAPIIGTELHTRTHYAMGLSGHGVNPSWIAGQVLASKVMGVHDEWTDLPICRESGAGLPPEPFRYLGGRLVRSSILRTEDSAQLGGSPPLWARVGAGLPKWTGIRLGTRR